MKLTRTDAVFSRTAMMLLYVYKRKVLGMSWKSTEALFRINKNFGRRIHVWGPTRCPRGWGRTYPPGRAPASWAPWCSTDLNSNSIYSRLGRKNQREGFIVFTIWSRRQALNSLGRADLESDRGSGEGNPSSLSSSTILHHQFHDAHRRA